MAAVRRDLRCHPTAPVLVVQDVRIRLGDLVVVQREEIHVRDDAAGVCCPIDDQDQLVDALDDRCARNGHTRVRRFLTQLERRAVEVQEGVVCVRQPECALVRAKAVRIVRTGGGLHGRLGCRGAGNGGHGRHGGGGRVLRGRAGGRRGRRGGRGRPAFRKPAREVEVLWSRRAGPTKRSQRTGATARFSGNPEEGLGAACGRPDADQVRLNGAGTRGRRVIGARARRSRGGRYRRNRQARGEDRDREQRGAGMPPASVNEHVVPSQQPNGPSWSPRSGLRGS